MLCLSNMYLIIKARYLHLFKCQKKGTLIYYHFTIIKALEDFLLAIL